MPQILIVDDEPNVASSLALLLQRAGYQTVIAHDGRAALDGLSSQSFDLVLLDLNLGDPLLDGLGVCRAIRARPDYLPIIMVTVRDSSLDKVIGLEVGVGREDLERLIRLTSNLLLLSRLESRQPLQRHPTNLSAVAEEAVLQLLEKADARRITLNVHTASRLARPAVDRDAWKQVFLNLIDNGIKYGATGGTVDVTLRQDDAGLMIAVGDDGAGIAPDDLPHLFTEMFRADAHRHISGTGLGLTIVRRIVEEHGGRITCSSEPGRGTTFHISLPLDSQDVTSP